jgi:hypothetical protein
MIFVQDNSVQSINAALNVIQKNQTPAQTSRGGRFSSSATNKFSISVSGNAISCYIPDFPELVANVTTVKLIFPQLDTGSPTLNINGLGAKPIKAVRAGQLVDIIAHTGYWEGAGSTSQRVWDNNTTLELIYDGTNWVVVGNPVLCSYFATDKSYSVYANGEIEQTATIYRGSNLSAGGIWTTTVTYQIVMSDTGYTLLMSAGDKGGGGEEEREVYDTRTTSSTQLNIYNRNSSTVCQSPSMTYTVKGL